MPHTVILFYMLNNKFYIYVLHIYTFTLLPIHYYYHLIATLPFTFNRYLLACLNWYFKVPSTMYLLVVIHQILLLLSKEKYDIFFRIQSTKKGTVKTDRTREVSSFPLRAPGTKAQEEKNKEKFHSANVFVTSNVRQSSGSGFQRWIKWGPHYSTIASCHHPFLLLFFLSQISLSRFVSFK